MRLPSFDKLLRDAGQTLARFPFVIAAGLFSTLAIWSHTDDFRYALVGFLGISVLYAISIFAERRTHNRVVRIVACALGVALLALYFMSLPDYRSINDVDMMRFALFVLVAHLAAAFAPFTGRDELNGFWQYNKTLFIRFLATALYTGVLYLGLTLALLAVEQLFDVDLNHRIYGDLGAILTGLFATWFFLAGVPPDMAALEGGSAYPQGLKIFTQYVLLPLVTIYLIILYLYAGKIMIAWELPTGWVSGLILGLAVAGILSLLLLYPIRNMEGNAWIRQFNRWFYRLILPLIVLLFLAIGRRIGDYGITEERYFVLALSVWLAAITIYFVISRRDNIKVIPISLAVTALLSSFGPWGAFEVSVRSQVEHLRRVLVEEKGLVNGTMTALSDTLDRDRESEINSIINYLDERDRLNELRGWLPGNPAVVMRDSIQSALGIQWDASYRPRERQFSINARELRTVRVQGYEYAVRFIRPYNSNDDIYDVGGTKLTLRLVDGNRVLAVVVGADTARFDVARFGQMLVDSLRMGSADSNVHDNYSTLEPEKLVMKGNVNGRPVAVAATLLSLSYQEGGAYRVENVEGTILISMTGSTPPPASAPARVDSVR